MGSSSEELKGRDQEPVAGRTTKLPASRAALSEEASRLDQRINDEVRGLEERLTASIRDEVARLEGLITDLYARLDSFIAEVGRADKITEELSVRLAELAELGAQPQATARAEARRLGALEDRLRALEDRS